MTDITCEMCMDLLPLVRDGIASDDSRRAVMAHMDSCKACAALYRDVPQTADASAARKAAVERIERRVQLLLAMILMFGILFGLSLTDSANLFYNILIMPVIGVLGYCIFRLRAAVMLPVLLFVTHLLLNLPGFWQADAHPDLYSLLIWTILYCIFALIGVLIAWLIHFALRKER